MDLSQTSAVEVIGQVEYRALHPQELQTDRLLLRPFSAEDAGGLACVLSDSEAAQFIGGPKSLDEARDSAIRMRDAFAQRGWGTLAVTLLDAGTCIGYCGVRPLSCTPDVELAFALERSCWGQGYATEAATAVLDAAFVCLRFESIVGTVYPENIASQRVLEKLGLKFERKVFGYWPRDEAWLLRVTRNDWKKRARA
ncbi:MAG: GNAT family N-acetyltransferase [Gammaproteobacteria bacterium]